MAINIAKYLHNDELNTVTKSYMLAYLQSKGIDIANIPVQSDNQWNLGVYQENYLIRTHYRSLFTAIICPVITNTDEAIRSQAIGSNIQERLLDVIAHLIANGHEKLPTRDIELAFYINRLNSHWTTLLVKYQGLDAKAYQTLFREYAVHAEKTGEHAQAKSLDIQVNNIKNFIITRQQMLVTDRDKVTNALILSNWKLPLDAKSIQLRHFDSMGKGTHSNQLVQKACSEFLLNHPEAKLTQVCPVVQDGNTCGDWSVYNAFRYGVYNKRTRHPDSRTLRYVTDNPIIENTRKILIDTKPDFNMPATQNAETNQPVIPTDPNGAGNHSNQDGTTAQPKLNWLSRQLNDRFPMLRNLTTLGITFSLVALINPVFLSVASVSAFLYSLAVVFAAAVVTMGLTHFMLKGMFGTFGVKFAKAEDGKPFVEKFETSGGFLNLLGINAPCRRTLEDIENDLESAYCTKTENGERAFPETAIVHQYAKEILNKHPDYFYPEDVKTVNAKGYVPVAKPKA